MRNTLFLTLILTLFFAFSASSRSAWAMGFGDCKAIGTGYYHSGPNDNLECASAGWNVASGGTAPTISDSIVMSPLAVPAIHTPYGVEGVLSQPANRSRPVQFDYGIVKGYDGFGAGVASASDKSFFSTDLSKLFVGTLFEPNFKFLDDRDPTGALTEGALALSPKVFSIGEYAKFAGGIGFRYRKSSGTTGLSYGFGVQIPVAFVVIDGGLSGLSENLGPTLPTVLISRQSIGVASRNIRIEYAHTNLSADTSTAAASNGIILPQTNLTASANTLSGNIRLGKFVLSAGERQQVDWQSNSSTDYYGALQCRISAKVSALYSYGLQIATHSLGVEIFL